ncbi:tRNA (adenosine(37)-N6)-dimethylallyltransferase MiaA [Rhodococcus antarcticus]|uniref:tRNA dimethylallyltransferase n=1 Tax=Rhodococcus antarcticus TaxID=2987751 RepID=A0ABY6P2H5_9NOCA|nr:tRNA (adenosine(37)-N6)-dimethylallyltransferase MiaA [Rhodococcus antarcticus]UZJ25854.1 tRNA (adenosine(37)-N6)-dimethylallyltransferase MiaA [Rhodococcus antarcticus]
MTAVPVRPVAVVGPTATGKSDLGLELAVRLGGEVVNVDAAQLYRGMDVGTAKTPLAQRRGVVHHQLDVLAVTDLASVAHYQQAARADVDGLLARGVVPVLVGGSGLYVQALLDELRFPATDPVVRARWEAELAERGSGALHAELGRVDPVAAAKVLPSDGRRVVRALEVVELTGQPFSASAPRVGTPRWDTVLVGVDRDTIELDARIEARTAAMFDGGLVAEVEHLVGCGLREGVTARRALGYAQVLDLLDGVHDEGEARRSTAAGTRRFVRRQRSWFRRDARVHWFDAARADLVDAVLDTLR